MTDTAKTDAALKACPAKKTNPLVRSTGRPARGVGVILVG